MPTTGLLIANDQAGGDIGAKVNAACAALPDGGFVIVLPGDYTLDTCMVLTPGITLKLGKGTITPSHNDRPLILAQSHTNIIGSGADTILIEPSVTMPIVIGDWDTWYAYQFGGSGYHFPGSSDVHISGLCCSSNDITNDPNGSIGAIYFGACRDVSVRDCFFKKCSGYGTAAGVTTGDATIYADGVEFSNNLYQNIKQQNCVIISARNVLIHDNLFRSYVDGDQNGCTGTFIDCESNTVEDLLCNMTIYANRFDVRTPTPGAAIAIISSGGVDQAKGISITGNVIDGDPDNAYNTNIQSNGIALELARDSYIANNTIRGVGQVAIGLDGSEYCSVKDNVIDSYIYNYPISVGGSIYCHVADNDIFNTYPFGSGTGLIKEFNTMASNSDFNLFTGNNIRLSPYPNAAVTADANNNAKIALVGAGSRAYNNYFNGQLINAASVRVAVDIANTAAQAGQTYKPTVESSGYAAIGDGGAGLHYWDDASTATHNGITVIAPANAATLTSGRWLRAPSFLRLTATERDALVLTSDDAGFIVYNTTTNRLNFWDSSVWRALAIV